MRVHLAWPVQALVFAWAAVALTSVAHCAVEEASSQAGAGPASSPVWVAAAAGVCANDACTNTTDDGVSVETCVGHSVVCYARACRFYDRCDGVPLAIWPNGTIHLVGAVRGDTGPASRLARLVGGWRKPEDVASTGGGDTAPNTEAWFAAAGIECGRVESRAAALVVDYYNLENYYHFHVDFMLRLFAQVERSMAAGGGMPIMFPAVPAWPGPGIDPHAEYWDNAGAAEPRSLPFWIQGLQALQAYAQSSERPNDPQRGGPLGTELVPGAVVPLSSASLRALTARGPLCLANAMLGLPFVDLELGGGYNISHRGEAVAPHEDWTKLESVQLDAQGITRNVPSPADRRAAEYLQRFARAMRRGLGLGDAQPQPHVEPSHVRVALISRSRRRKIVNEPELLAAVQSALPDARIKLLRFERMTYREQVQAVGDVDVLLGMNGAGLTNALFRHRCAVAVQLMPYRAPLNFREFGLLLRAGGPYLEWHNVRKADSVTQPGPGMHQPASNQGTRVLADEFVQLVREATRLHEACVRSNHQ